MRIEYPGAIYHVMNRGDRKEPIFMDDTDRLRFLDTLADCCAKTGFEIHVYALMWNHFHLVLETPRGNLVAGMKWLLGTYTGRFNRRHRCVGHLFAGRYKALIVDGSGDGYFRTVCDYVHLNPARADRLSQEVPLRSWRWTSLAAYLDTPDRRPSWLRVDRLFGELGFGADCAQARKALEQHLERMRAKDTEAMFYEIRHGWFLGGKDREEEMLLQVAQGRKEHHAGGEIERSDNAKATRILREELECRGWTESDLATRKKGDPAKVVIAKRLRRETAVTLKWIASALRMGHWTYVNSLLSGGDRRRKTLKTRN
jgi:REP element-mobilizing transposase RayT